MTSSNSPAVFQTLHAWPGSTLHAAPAPELLTAVISRNTLLFASEGGEVSTTLSALQPLMSLHEVRTQGLWLAGRTVTRLPQAGKAGSTANLPFLNLRRL